MFISATYVVQEALIFRLARTRRKALDRAWGSTPDDQRRFASLIVVAILTACSSSPVRPSSLPTQTLTLTPDNRLMRDATATARMAPMIVSPAVPTETTAPDLSGLRDVWAAYINDDLGFTFEYPAAYGVEPFKSRGCAIQASNNRVVFGSDNSLSVASAEGLDLAEYVDRFVQQQGSSFDPWRRDNLFQNGELRGIIVEYFLRGVNHSGILAFFQRDDNVYIFRVRLSLACSMPEINLVSPGPFYHAVESFKFTR